MTLNEQCFAERVTKSHCDVTCLILPASQLTICLAHVELAYYCRRATCILKNTMYF